MAYIGNTPAEAFSAFQKQDFSTSATTSYTLDRDWETTTDNMQ